MRSVLLVLMALLLPAAAFSSDFFIVWPGHPTAPALPDPRDDAVVNEWQVEINMRGIAANTAAVSRINVRLPEGERSYVMRRFTDISGFELVGEDDFQIRPDARDEEISYTWYGEAGTEQMTIAVYQGVMSATLTGSEGVYTLIRRGRAPVFQQIDVRRIPPSVEFPAPPSDASWQLSSRKRLTASAPRPKSAIDTVDVLVVHTAAALAHSTIGGSTANLNARILDSFVQVQDAMANSGMDSVRVRNVLTSGDLSIQVGYNEVPSHTCAGSFPGLCRWFGHRVWLRTSAEVANLRNTHGADLVVMLVGDDLNFAGIAYPQNIDCGFFQDYENTPGCDIGAAYAPFAFSVASVKSATSFQVFAHEVGHQFGMQHQSTGAIPAYPWSFAKTRSDQQLQTLVGDVQIIPRSLQFSNPNVPFIGTTEPSGETLRFNARTGVCLAPAMSGFRTPGQLFRLYADGFEERLVPPLGC